MPMMSFMKNRKHLWILAGVFAAGIAGLAIVVTQAAAVERAHSSFENYYVFRGCQQLISRTDSSARCRLASGKIITLVDYQRKWYLQGDLPVCWLPNHMLCL